MLMETKYTKDNIEKIKAAIENAMRMKEVAIAGMAAGKTIDEMEREGVNFVKVE